MDGFQRRKERKKDTILFAALTLFKDFGIKKVSVTEIADQANVSQVTIYNYFGSKDDLIHAVMVYYLEEIWRDYEILLDSNLSYDKKIKQIIFKEGEIANQISETFFKEFMTYYKADSYINDYYTNKVVPRMIQFFDEGKRLGYVNPNISNDAIFFYIQMFMEYMQREEVNTKMLSLTEDVITLFFYGIFGKDQN
ncbi:TetR/AcrR family transcriptional regulator [Virgibacillus litoralis]|uniref:AcrR family transcriptional regulator n=1 Tax=Virgibacillus litoralis TaxID=578221 RepID=A0ABS4HDE9_9BACI|nr:TetR/AcrR family transcriptional regulator [Virgibacillus litoralis]MBP1948467.1 AcrR family transcriptional regulator [Virgibacillus litoralis]